RLDPPQLRRPRGITGRVEGEGGGDRHGGFRGKWSLYIGAVAAAHTAVILRGARFLARLEGWPRAPSIASFEARKGSHLRMTPHWHRAKKKARTKRASELATN